MADFGSGQFIDSTDLDPVTFDTGDFCWSGRRTKTGWLKCDGSAVSRTTYATLFAAIVPSLGTTTVTIASPGVFTLTAHGLVIGDALYLTTTGALPTGLSANTIYYVVSTPTSDTFTVSATQGGSAINTSGSQSGTHTAYYCPYGLGDGSTTFNVPDAGGRVLAASAGASGHSSVRAQGQNDGVALANRSPIHNSTMTQAQYNIQNDVSGSGSPTLRHDATGNSGQAGPAVNGSVGPGGTLAVDQPANIVANLFIKI
jgi:microcystin-dependent protein